jgi:hypothetical protein
LRVPLIMVPDIGVSVRNKVESKREGENKSTKEIERMTR